MGRGGQLNNEKNMSQIRCFDNTYQTAYPQIVKARHIKLAFGAENKAKDEGNNEARVSAYRATKNDHDLFKPRRAAVAKSFDFTVSDRSGIPRTGRNFNDSSEGGRSNMSKMN